MSALPPITTEKADIDDVGYPPEQARRLIDDALSRVLPGKSGDKELARRKAWIRKEIVRRLG